MQQLKQPATGCYRHPASKGRTTPFSIDQSSEKKERGKEKENKVSGKRKQVVWYLEICMPRHSDHLLQHRAVNSSAAPWNAHDTQAYRAVKRACGAETPTCCTHEPAWTVEDLCTSGL